LPWWQHGFQRGRRECNRPKRLTLALIESIHFGMADRRTSCATLRQSPSSPRGDHAAHHRIGLDGPFAAPARSRSPGACDARLFRMEHRSRETRVAEKQVNQKQNVWVALASGGRQCHPPRWDVQPRATRESRTTGCQTVRNAGSRLATSQVSTTRPPENDGRSLVQSTGTGKYGPGITSVSSPGDHLSASAVLMTRCSSLCMRASASGISGNQARFSRGGSAASDLLPRSNVSNPGAGAAHAASQQTKRPA